LSFEVTESGIEGVGHTSARLDDASEEALDEEPTSDLDDAPVSGRIYLHGVSTELNRRLSAIAEAGCISGLAAHRDWLEKCPRDLHAAGLTFLAGVLSRLSEVSSSAASDLLKARFLTHLHSQAAAHVLEPGSN